MVKIISPYAGQSSPIAQAVAQIGAAAFGDTLTPEIKRQRLTKLSRENQGISDLQAALPGMLANPQNLSAIQQGLQAAIAGGYAPSQVGDALRVGAANVYGATDPRTTNATVGAGGAYSSTAPAFQQAQQNSLLMNREDNATRERIAGSTPVEAMTPEGPRYVTRATAPGQMPLAPESNVKGGYLAQNFGNVGALPIPEQNILGATKREPEPEMVQLQRQRNQMWAAAGRLPLGDPARDDLQRQGDELDMFIKRKLSGSQGFSITQPDGTVISMGGTGGGDAVGRRTAEVRLRNSGQARDIIATIGELVDRSPQAVGAAGNLLRLGQDATSVASTVTQVFGGEKQYVGELMRIGQDLRSKGINVPSLLNPDLNSAETLSNLLIYKTAEALGQSGNGVSDKDLANVRNIVGDPTSWFTSPETLKNKLATLDSILARDQERDAGYLGRAASPPKSYALPSGKDMSRAPGGAPAPGQVDMPRAAAPGGAPAAPAPPPAAVPEGATATNPNTGQKIQFRNGQWGPM